MNPYLRLATKQWFVAAAAVFGLAGSSVAQSPNWTPVTGPGTPGYGGLVRFSQGTPDGAFWIATEGGGVHKSVDSGATWTAMNNGLEPLTIKDALFDIGASTNTVTSTYKAFVATHGGGVFKTLDGGASWAAINGGLGCHYVTTLAGMTNRLLAGTDCQGAGGVYYADTSSNWIQATGMPGNVKVNSFRRVNPTGSGLDFWLANTESGIYRSNDSGTTWSALSASPSGPNGANVYNVRVLYYTNTSTSANVLRLVATVEGAGIFVSEDSGSTWAASNTGLPANPIPMGGARWDGNTSTLYLSLDGAGTYKSNDRGANWSFFAGSSALPPTRGISPASATMLIADTLAGPYKSTDGGANWTGSGGAGLPGGWTTNLKMDNATPTPNIYAAAADGVYKLIGTQWSKMPSLPGMAHGQVKTRGATIYATTSNKGVYKFDASAGAWQAINTGLPTNLVGRSPKYVGDGANASNAFLGLYGDGVYYTSDAGANWAARNNGLSGAALRVNSMDIFAGTNPYAYIATDGGLYKSIDGGLNWTFVFAPKNASNQSLPVGFVTVDPQVTTTVYVAAFNTDALGGTLASNGVYKSTDSGATWTQLTGMAGKKVRDVEFVGDASDTLVAAAWDEGVNGGLFASMDDGVTWSRISEGLTSNLINRVMTTSTGGYAATRGQGLFTFTDSSSASTEWKYFGLWSNGTSANYGVSYGANDSTQAVSGITVSGGGLSANAVYWPTDMAWHADLQFGATAPPNTNVYTATVTPKTGSVTTTTFSIRAAGFNTAFPTNVQPSGGANVADALPVFSWTPPANGITYKYGVNLQDVANGYAQVWNTYNLTGTSITYPSNAPALVPGKTYQINVQSNEFDSTTNTTYGATRAETFCFQCTGTGGGGTTTQANFDQLFIARNKGIGDENFGVGVRYPRAANDGMASYAITCPGGKTAGGSFGTSVSSGTGFEWYNVSLGTVQPATPFDCTSTVTYSNGTTNTVTLTVDKFADAAAYPTGISFADNVNVFSVSSFTSVNFTNPVPGTTRVQANVWSVNTVNGSMQQLWFVSSVASPLAYNGPTLMPNTPYQFTMATVDGTTVMHAAQVFIPFCYQCVINGGGGTGTGTNLSIAPNWNLLGNSVETPMAVATSFGDKAKVISVWKWVVGVSPAPSGWAFYSPALPNGGTDYAVSKGYIPLTTINAGEGFWINSASTTSYTVPLPSGTAVASNSFKPSAVFGNSPVAGGSHALAPNWSLISTGDNPTPSVFSAALSTIASTPPAAGSSNVYTNLNTLWAWSTANGGGWYFWSPILVNNSGLANYILSKNYIDFGSTGTLAPGVGFWVNMP